MNRFTAWRRVAELIHQRSEGQVTVLPPDDLSIPERDSYRDFLLARLGPAPAASIQPMPPTPRPPLDLLLRLANPHR